MKDKLEKEAKRIAIDLLSNCALPRQLGKNQFLVHAIPLILKALQRVDKAARHDERYQLWLNHGCPVDGLYGDDGEMQCGQGHIIDFKRDPWKDIFKRLMKSEKVNVDKAAKKATFPMQNGPKIPWSLAEVLYAGYSACYGTDQSLDRIAQRGGFGWDEIASMWKDSAKFREAIRASGESR